MTLKPFNLQLAQAGDPIVTRDGRQFVFGGYNPIAKDHVRIIGWIDGELSNRREYGRILSTCDTGSDLFMASKKRTIYVSIGRDKSDELFTSVVCDTKAQAEQWLNDFAIPIQQVAILSGDIEE